MHDRPHRVGGQGHHTAQERCGRGRQGKLLGEPCTDLPTGCYPKGFQALTEANCHPRPGFHKGREALSKNLAGTVHGIAEELPHMQDELHTEARAWQISYHASIVAMATFRWTETERTKSSLFRTSYLNLQQVINGFNGYEL